MSLTPLYALLIVALLLAFLAVTYFTMAGSKQRSFHEPEMEVPRGIEQCPPDVAKHHLTTRTCIDRLIAYAPHRPNEKEKS